MTSSQQIVSSCTNRAGSQQLYLNFVLELNRLDMGRNPLSKWWSIFSELIGARDSNVDKTRRSSFGKCSLVMKHETLRSLESSLQNCYSIHCCVFHSAFQGDWESKPLLCASTTKRPRWRWFDFTSDRNFRQCSRHEGGLLSSIEQGILPHANFIFFCILTLIFMKHWIRNLKLMPMLLFV